MGRVPPETSDREISGDLYREKRGNLRKKGNWSRLMEIGKGGGVKLKIEGRKVRK